MLETRHKLRISEAHYAGGLVDGARLLQLFGDIATELLIRLDGDEGLFRAYDRVDFLAPVQAGDFLELVGRITAVGNSSRRMEFKAWKYITPTPEHGASAADLLDPPQLVCSASGTCITPQQKQRKER